MGKVSVESSSKLSVLSSSIYEIKDNFQENLKMLNTAFAIACESWQDKNAQTCSNALNEHNAAMHSALWRLSEIENSVECLSKLAAEYEDI